MKRKDIIKIVTSINPTGIGVEIGVQKGKFSAQILNEWNKGFLFLVDPWKEFPKNEYSELGNVSQERQEAFYEETICRLAPYADRYRVIRETSEQAVKQFEDNYFDFVYIDANHKYEYIKQDIELWYPKVKKGGVFAGHDYYNSNILNICGVKRAVTEWTKKENIVDKVVITQEIIPSWFIIKG